MADSEAVPDDWTPLQGGFSTKVSRRGQLVRRQTGPYSSAVHHLLRWLQDGGFSRVPQVVEINAGEEVLTYLVGEPVFRPWRETVKTDDWMRELGMWLHEYHTAVQEFRLPDGARFSWGPAQPADGMLVNHGDLGPWNMIERQGRLVGAIDWDLARFGEPLDDLAQLALEAVPLKPSTTDRLGANPEPELIHRRLAVLCHAYGESDLTKILRHTTDYLERMALEIEHSSQKERWPFVQFLVNGLPTEYRTEAKYLRQVFDL